MRIRLIGSSLFLSVLTVVRYKNFENFIKSLNFRIFKYYFLLTAVLLKFIGIFHHLCAKSIKYISMKLLLRLAFDKTMEIHFSK